MDKLRHPQFIINYVSLFKIQKYLELGLYIGETYNQICDIVPICVGVDIINYGITKGEFYLMSTHDFFIINKLTFDVIFIDADHQFNNVKEDLLKSLNILQLGGTIFLHDTDPIDNKYIDPGYCGDAYKINQYIRNECIDLDMIILPIGHEGLTMVKRQSDKRVLK